MVESDNNTIDWTWVRKSKVTKDTEFVSILNPPLLSWAVVKVRIHPIRDGDDVYSTQHQTS